VKLVYAEKLPDRSSAMKREIAIKKLTRAQKQALIQTACKNPNNQ
jgi:putative endonuclease